MPTVLEAFSILREIRQPQLDMATLVDRCITDEKNAAIEAGTGTGKSFGYLIPVVSQGRRAIVSTGTIALQEQLIRQDLPWLQKAMWEQFKVSFRFAMLKGASNYLCNRRANEEFGDLPDDVAAWVEETPTGDLGEAPEMPYGVKESIRKDGDDCANRKCAVWAQCHHKRAKEAAKHADVLVVVHAMTTMGLGEPYGLSFDDYDALIVDEAHQFEDYARSSFEGRLSPTRLSRFFKAVEAHLIRPIDGDRWTAWEAARDRFRKAWVDVIAPWLPTRHADGKPFDDEKCLVDIAWVRTKAEPACEALSDVASMVMSRVLDSEPEHAKILRQLEGIRGFFQEIGAGDAIAVAERKVQPDQRNAAVTMVTFPLFIGERLKKHLYPLIPVIYTSATISAGGDFTMFREQVGLDEDTPTAEIGSPFDYPRQSLLYVPRDSRLAGDVADVHGPAVREEIERLVKLSRGRAFVLFTSNKAMREAFHARRHSFPSRWQEPDSNKNALIQWFKETPGAVLYATASFWEGVSIEGEQLSLVVIDKIPFPPPTDPIFKAKEARYPQGKGFFRLSVPSAILKLKQGFGRLVRTQQDRGMVAILDSRIHGKGYGRQVLVALPPATLITDLDDQEIVADYLAGPLPVTVPTVIIQDDAHLAAVLDAAEAIPADAPAPVREEAARAALTATPDDLTPEFWAALAAWEAA